MPLLKICDKFSVEYDPVNNDRPTRIFRHGAFWRDWDESNLATSMFYTLLEKSNA